MKIEKSKLREAEEKEDDNFNPGDSENDNDQSLWCNNPSISTHLRGLSKVKTKNHPLRKPF